jgi:hypothetical protein
MRVTASIPAWAIQEAARKMRETGIRVSWSSIVLYAIGKLIGIPDTELREFAQPKPGRRPGQQARTVEDFLTTLDSKQCVQREDKVSATRAI